MLEKPIRIGTLEVKNRLVKAAVVENLASEEGRVTDELVALYEKAARGGAGLIVTGGSYVHPGGRNLRFQTGAYADDLIPGLARLAHAGRQNDARIILQISHGGRQCPPTWVANDVVGPSAVQDRMSKITPRAMQAHEIEHTIEAFGQAAGRAKQAGFDGVEIMAGHGYLINQFLSRRTNRRQDQWGGDLENRARFYSRIIAAVRLAVGDGFPILTKINSEDRMHLGFSLNECAWVVRRLSDWGVAAVQLTGGTYESALNIARGDIPQAEILQPYRGWQRWKLQLIIALMRRKFRFSEAYFLENAKKIGRDRRLPLILVGGLRTPRRMEEILEQGHADMIALGRPLIRRPDWPQRILNGDLRPSTCLNCNRCFIRITQDQPVRCYAAEGPL